MANDAEFEEINTAKANLDKIYDQPDPRIYFSELRELQYGIPGAAKPIFQRLCAQLRKRRDPPIRVLDLGCSYGVNAALLKYGLSMPQLYARWGNEKLANASSEEVVQYDERYFASLDKVEDIEVVGLDMAGQAVEFATDVGLLDDALAVNLESEPLPISANGKLAAVDMVISTGCVGYLTEKSFKRLMPSIAREQKPWIANFVLRMFPFDAIEQTLSDWGYVTEKLEGHSFVQRKFASAQEQEQVLEQLQEQGIDPNGKETEGNLLAEFYLSRPAQEVSAAPLAQLALN